MPILPKLPKINKSEQKEPPVDPLATTPTDFVADEEKYLAALRYVARCHIKYARIDLHSSSRDRVDAIRPMVLENFDTGIRDEFIVELDSLLEEKFGTQNQ